MNLDILERINNILIGILIIAILVLNVIFLEPRPILYYLGGAFSIFLIIEAILAYIIRKQIKYIPIIGFLVIWSVLYIYT